MARIELCRAPGFARVVLDDDDFRRSRSVSRSPASDTPGFPRQIGSGWRKRVPRGMVGRQEVELADPRACSLSEARLGHAIQLLPELPSGSDHYWLPAFRQVVADSIRTSLRDVGKSDCIAARSASTRRAGHDREDRQHQRQGVEEHPRDREPGNRLAAPARRQQAEGADGQANQRRLDGEANARGRSSTNSPSSARTRRTPGSTTGRPSSRTGATSDRARVPGTRPLATRTVAYAWGPSFLTVASTGSCFLEGKRGHCAH